MQWEPHIVEVHIAQRCSSQNASAVEEHEAEIPARTIHFYCLLAI